MLACDVSCPSEGLLGLVAKASASRATGLGSIPACTVDFVVVVVVVVQGE